MKRLTLGSASKYAITTTSRKPGGTSTGVTGGFGKGVHSISGTEPLDVRENEEELFISPPRELQSLLRSLAACNIRANTSTGRKDAIEDRASRPSRATCCLRDTWTFVSLCLAAGGGHGMDSSPTHSASELKLRSRTPLLLRVVSPFIVISTRPPGPGLKATSCSP